MNRFMFQLCLLQCNYLILYPRRTVERIFLTKMKFKLITCNFYPFRFATKKGTKHIFLLRMREKAIQLNDKLAAELGS